MTDPWDDAQRTQAGFVVTTHGLRVPVAAPVATPGWPAPQDSAPGPAPAGASGFRGVGPKGYRRSDPQMRDQVCERLLLDPYLDASAITVRVSKGRISLSGHVPSERMRAAAIAAAASVATGIVADTLKVTAAGAGVKAKAPKTARKSGTASRAKGRRKRGGQR